MRELEHDPAKALGDKPVRVFVATPAYDGKVHTDYALSMVESSMLALANGVRVEASIAANGAFIEVARNMFVKMFLDTDCTHLFFIDADLKWEPRAFLGLVMSGRPICAGVYPKREPKECYPVRYHEDGGGVQPFDGGWIPCERVPTGFLCIRRDVVEAMAEESPKWHLPEAHDVPRLFYTKITEEGGFVGEDYCFSDDFCEMFGEHIPVWPDYDFVHDGKPGNWHNFMNRCVEEEEAKRSAA